MRSGVGARSSPRVAAQTGSLAAVPAVCGVRRPSVCGIRGRFLRGGKRTTNACCSCPQSGTDKGKADRHRNTPGLCVVIDHTKLSAEGAQVMLRRADSLTLLPRLRANEKTLLPRDDAFL